MNPYLKRLKEEEEALMVEKEETLTAPITITMTALIIIVKFV